MRWLLRMACSFVLACGAAPSTSIEEPSDELACVHGAPDGSPAATLDWMIGTWVSEEEGRVTAERWCVGEGGALIGDSRTVVDDRVVHTEVLRIEARGESLVYVASPSGQATTEFVGAARCGSAAIADNCARSCEATFENPAHDFPTSINYGRCAESELLVATIRGGERRASWTFTRVEP